MKIVEELIPRWKAQADLLEELQSPIAAAYRRLAHELETALGSAALEELTLEQAEKESGFDRDSLSRMMRQGRIPNAGTPRHPRIKRRDLPRKPPARPGKLTPSELMSIVPRRKSS